MLFDFLNRSQLELIDNQCLQYGKWHNMLVPDCPALRLLYDHLASSGITGPDLSRRIALALEIKLGFVHTHYDLANLAGLENRYLVPDDAREKYRPYEDVRSFSIALSRARSAFGLITRIRSIWDKTFLYVALIREGDTLVQQLQGQKSKRRFFFAHFAEGVGHVTPEILSSAKEALKRLEKDFRTPELHGFGNSRFPRPSGRGTLRIQAALVRCPARPDTEHNVG